MGQQVEFSPQSSKEEGTTIPTSMCPIFYKSDSKGEDDMMVSETRVEIVGAKRVLMVLLDSGCTHFMISPQVVEKLQMRLRKIRYSPNWMGQ